VNILEGVIFGKNAVGRPGLRYLKQVARNRGTDSYRAMERMACSKSRKKAANQSKDGGIRRRRKCRFNNQFHQIQPKHPGCTW